ncbi:MAG: hypothetical protein JWM47_2781 [Acidimicrobiales bacterium]|nr:hypothetical protein [Acidimicrobiales bacterium]
MTGRRLSAVALAATLLLTWVGAPAAARPSGNPPPAATAAPRITVEGQDFEVAADGDFRVFLDITGAPAGSTVAVDIYDRIETVEDLAASTTPEPNGLLDNFDPFPLRPSDDEHQVTGFTIYLYGEGDDLRRDVPRPWVYELDEPGVYPVKIKLRDADGAILTTVVTYLVRQPADDQEVTPSDVALLTTVHQPPAPADPTGAGAAPVSAAYRERLDAVLQALADQPELPATFAVTPETAVRLGADPEAADTMIALGRAVDPDGDGLLLGGTYVDVDPAALVANDLRGELVRQAQLGRAALALTAGTPRATTWMVDHQLDRAAIDALHDLGVTRLVLPSSAVTGDQDQVAGPVRLPSTSGTVEAVTTGFFDLAGTRPEDPVLSGHQLYARLAATATINDGPAGVAVRVDPATADPVQLRTLLEGLGKRTTFVRATDLDRVFRDAPASGAPATLGAIDPPDLGRYPAELRRTRRLIDSYQSMVPDRPELGQGFRETVAVSASADLSLAERRRRLVAVEGELRDRFGGISTPASDRVTLGARNARFPLPITSKLGEPMKVVISLEASDRLSFPDETIEATLVGDRTLVQIPVRTRATGDTPLHIVVRTPDGGVVLAESRYRVRSTAVSNVGVLLTIGAGGFLALWWGRHWIRTRRRHRGRHGRVGDGPPSPAAPAGPT